MNGGLKPIRWIRTSLRDLRSFPRAVRIDIGHALFIAQESGIDPAAKPLKSFGGASMRTRNCSCAPQKYLTSHLYHAFRRRNLCFARISEEVHEKHRDTNKQN